jgi:hypothetical protein
MYSLNKDEGWHSSNSSEAGIEAVEIFPTLANLLINDSRC